MAIFKKNMYRWNFKQESTFEPLKGKGKKEMFDLIWKFECLRLYDIN